MTEAAATPSTAGPTASADFLAAVNSDGNTGGNGGPPTSLREALSQPAEPRDVSPQEAAEQPNREPPQRRQEAKQDGQAQTVRIKVNGQERDVPIRDVVDYYQRGESANKRFQEAAALRKDAEARASRAEALLKDPKALVDAVLNSEAGAKTLHDAYQEMARLAKLTPEQQEEFLRMKELEGRDAKLREMETAEQTRQEQARQDAMIDQHLDGIEDAFQKMGYAPSEKVQDLTDMLAASMIEQIQEDGIQGVKYRDVAATIVDVINDVTAEAISTASDDQLVKWIGEKRFQKLVGTQVKSVQSRLPAQVPRDGRPMPDRQPNGQFTNGPIVMQRGDMNAFRKLVEGR